MRAFTDETEDVELDAGEFAERFEELAAVRGVERAARDLGADELPVERVLVRVFQHPTGLWVYDEADECVTEAEEWVFRLSPLELDELAPLDDYARFWAAPPVLLHGTRADRVEEITRTGLQARSETRGMSNGDVGPAVFASLSRDFCEYHYDAIVEIDCPGMAADGHTLEVGGEPPLMEAEQRRAVAWRLGIEDFDPQIDTSDGLHPDTVIVYGDIPARYVRVLDRLT